MLIQFYLFLKKDLTRPQFNGTDTDVNGCPNAMETIFEEASEGATLQAGVADEEEVSEEDMLQAAGTAVSYSLPVFVDDGDPDVNVVCSPSSGTWFTMEESPHTITCTATDNNGLQTSCSIYDIIVRGLKIFLKKY